MGKHNLLLAKLNEIYSKRKCSIRGDWKKLAAASPENLSVYG